MYLLEFWWPKWEGNPKKRSYVYIWLIHFAVQPKITLWEVYTNNFFKNSRYQFISFSEGNEVLEKRGREKTLRPIVSLRWRDISCKIPEDTEDERWVWKSFDCNDPLLTAHSVHKWSLVSDHYKLIDMRLECLTRQCSRRWNYWSCPVVEHDF